MIHLRALKQIPVVWISVLFIGHSAHAIFGGTPISKDDPLASSILALIHDFPQGRDSTPCGAIAVSSRAVLTAAHCVSDLNRVIRLYQTVDLIRSVFRPSRFVRVSLPTEVQREQIFLHPDYRKHENGGEAEDNADLAVIVFAQGLPWKTTAMAIGDPAQLAQVGSLILAGYGEGFVAGEDQGVLQQVRLTRIADPSAFRLAVDQSKGSGICRGDSGGPAFVFDQMGRPILLGVNSYVTGPTKALACRDRAGLVNVWSHRAWLQQFLD